MDLWTIFSNSVTALIILFITWCIYDCLCDIAWLRKYNLKGPIPLPLVKNLIPNFFKPLDKQEAQYIKEVGTHGPCRVGIVGCIRAIYIYDVDLLKKIMIKDHLQFQNRFSIEGMNPYPVDYGLLSLKDEEWKRVRNIITPSFSAGKIKMMVPEMNYCGELLCKGLMEKATAGETIESRKHFGCYTMDVIAATAFGLRTDAYSNPQEKFVSLASKVFSQSIFGPALLFALHFPTITKFLHNTFNWSVFYPVDSLKFFTEVVRELIEDRKKNEDKSRVDLLQQMMNAELQEESLEQQTKKKLDIHELLGQGFFIFIAGYETTAGLLSYLSYFLAIYPEIQEKLIEEIDEHIKDVSTDIKYDTVMEMKYLEQVINETLRFYPPVARMNRTTSKNQDIQVDGHWFPADTLVGFSIYMIHHMPEYYPEPEQFKPERFSPEEKAKRDPFVFMPFGHGPRNCIGMRLGLLEAKIAVIHVLKKVKFVKCAETQIPLEIIHETFLRPKKPIKVGVELR